MEAFIRLNLAIRNLDLNEVEKIVESHPSLIHREQIERAVDGKRTSSEYQEFEESPFAFLLHEYVRFVGETRFDVDETLRQNLNAILHCLCSRIDLNQISIEASGGFQRAPLCHSVTCPELVEQLLKLGADPNYRCGEPFRRMNDIDIFPWLCISPLVCAASEANYLATDTEDESQDLRRSLANSSVSLFLKAGATIDTHSALFLEPIDAVSARLEAEEVSGELMCRGLSQVIGMAGAKNRSHSDPVALVSLLLNFGLKPKPGDLASALLRGEQGLAIARLLLDAGVDPNECDEFGQTQIAALRQRNLETETDIACFQEMIKLLTNFGGKENALSGQKKSATTLETNSALAQLKAWMPPPKAPVQIDHRALQSVVEEIGTTLPGDFLEFVKTYGRGEIRIGGAGQWKIWNPFDPSFLDNYRSFVEIHREIRQDEDFEDDRVGSFELLPDDNGILPFMSSDSCGYFAWQVSGAPNTWKSVQFEDDYDVPPVTEHEFGFAEFLVALLRQEISCRFFPNAKWDPLTDVVFVPAKA